MSNKSELRKWAKMLRASLNIEEISKEICTNIREAGV